MTEFKWNTVEISRPPSEWFVLDDSSWDALISAWAGMSRLLRQPKDDQQLNGDDQEIVDSFINDHLKAANIYPRPPGYVWFLKPPPGVSDLDSLHRQLNAFIQKRSTRDALPTEVSELVKTFMELKYAERSTEFL